jgi:hypothetical protein
MIIKVEADTDFLRIADELRRAAREVREAARRDPAQSAALENKARKLSSAAARIEADAHARQGFIAINDTEQG